MINHLTIKPTHKNRSIQP